MADRPAVIDTEEGQRLDRKSLRVVQGGSTDFEELAKDCVCFANGSGGQLLIGIEDDASLPSALLQPVMAASTCASGMTANPSSGTRCCAWPMTGLHFLGRH